MHRALVAGEDRRVRTHCRAAYWQVRDIVLAVCTGGKSVYNDSQCNPNALVLDIEQLQNADFIARLGLASGVKGLAYELFRDDFAQSW